MEGLLCAMALKSTNGRQKHHTQPGLHVCCELALKGAGRQVRETARAKEVARGTSGYRGDDFVWDESGNWLRGLIHAGCRQVGS
jgi:hypothetical protein